MPPPSFGGVLSQRRGDLFFQPVFDRLFLHRVLAAQAFGEGGDLRLAEIGFFQAAAYAQITMTVGFPVADAVFVGQFADVGAEGIQRAGRADHEFGGVVGDRVFELFLVGARRVGTGADRAGRHIGYAAGAVRRAFRTVGERTGRQQAGGQAGQNQCFYGCHLRVIPDCRSGRQYTGWLGGI